MLYRWLGLGGRIIRARNMRGLPQAEIDDRFHLELLFIGIVLAVGLLVGTATLYDHLYHQYQFEQWQKSGYTGPAPR